MQVGWVPDLMTHLKYTVKSYWVTCDLALFWRQSFRYSYLMLELLK